MRRVDEVDELETAVEEALRFDDHVLVERYIEGTEVHVAVLGGRPLGAVEVDCARAPVRLRARASGAAMPLYVPPRLSPERLRGALTLAMRATRALECTGLCEVDIVVSERGNEQVLEVDTQPSLAAQRAGAQDRARRRPVVRGSGARRCLHEARLHTARRASGTRRLRLDERIYAGPDRRAQPTEPH